MENISNHTDLTVFRYLLLPLFLYKDNIFLTYFAIQCCQITVSNTFEAICGFWSPEINSHKFLFFGLQKLQIASKSTYYWQWPDSIECQNMWEICCLSSRMTAKQRSKNSQICDLKYSPFDPYCKDLNWLNANDDPYFGKKLNCWPL